MISPALSLDTIVTTIACLCSTTNVRESEVSTLLNLSHLTPPEIGVWEQPQKLQNIEKRLLKMEIKFAAIKQILSANQKIPPPLENCDDLNLDAEEEQIVQYILPNSEIFTAICKNADPYGNWLLIQRHLNNKEIFYSNLQAYKFGFGSSGTDFFIGLERLYQMTKSKHHDLLIRFKKEIDETFLFAYYNYFTIEKENGNYYLKSLGTYNGTTGDIMRSHFGYKFPKNDDENDIKTKENCATKYQGAWWISNCLISNLNDEHFSNGKPINFITLELFIRPVKNEIDLWDL